jgi:hypothetical protein
MFVGDDHGRPTYLVLKPSSGDIKQAADVGQSIRVSVWDIERTSLAQASSFRGRVGCLPFLLAVADVNEQAKQLPNRTMRVVYDELGEPEQSLPGADGHAGIEGLEKGAVSGESETAWKRRLKLLADCLRPYEE